MNNSATYIACTYTYVYYRLSVAVVLNEITNKSINQGPQTLFFPQNSISQQYFANFE